MTYPVCDKCDCVAGCSKNPEPCLNLLAAQIERHRAACDMHSCSPYCDKPPCVKWREALKIEAVGAGELK